MSIKCYIGEAHWLPRGAKIFYAEDDRYIGRMLIKQKVFHDKCKEFLDFGSELIFSSIPPQHNLIGSYSEKIFRDEKLEPIFKNEGIKYLKREGAVIFVLSSVTDIKTCIYNNWWDCHLWLTVSSNSLNEFIIPRIKRRLLFFIDEDSWYFGNLKNYYSVVRIHTCEPMIEIIGYNLNIEQLQIEAFQIAKKYDIKIELSKDI